MVETPLRLQDHKGLFCSSCDTTARPLDELTGAWTPHPLALRADRLLPTPGCPNHPTPLRGQNSSLPPETHPAREPPGGTEDGDERWVPARSPLARPGPTRPRPLLLEAGRHRPRGGLLLWSAAGFVAGVVSGRPPPWRVRRHLSGGRHYVSRRAAGRAAVGAGRALFCLRFRCCGRG